MKPIEYLNVCRLTGPEYQMILKDLLELIEHEGYHLIKEGEVPPWFHDFAFVGDVTHWSGSHETDSQPLYRIVSDNE